MCSRLYISVFPSAIIPAIIRAAPARKSDEYTGEPYNFSTPSKNADLP